MTSLQQDIALSIMFIMGLFCFFSGSFIVSTVFFATAAVFSNLTRFKSTQTQVS